MKISTRRKHAIAFYSTLDLRANRESAVISVDTQTRQHSATNLQSTIGLRAPKIFEVLKVDAINNHHTEKKNLKKFRTRSE